MQELQEIVNAKVQSMVSEKVIQKAIEDGIQGAIEKAIASQFQSYGAITKQQASRYLVKHFGLPVQNELANATIDSFCPSRPASATIPYDTLQLAARATLHHDYHSDSTAMIAAAASSPSLARAPNYESADGIAYWGLTAPASLSMAVSD